MKLTEVKETKLERSKRAAKAGEIGNVTIVKDVDFATEKFHTPALFIFDKTPTKDSFASMFRKRVMSTNNHATLTIKQGNWFKLMVKTPLAAGQKLLDKLEISNQSSFAILYPVKDRNEINETAFRETTKMSLHDLHDNPIPKPKVPKDAPTFMLWDWLATYPQLHVYYMTVDQVMAKDDHTDFIAQVRQLPSYKRLFNLAKKYEPKVTFVDRTGKLAQKNGTLTITVMIKTKNGIYDLKYNIYSDGRLVNQTFSQIKILKRWPKPIDKPLEMFDEALKILIDKELPTYEAKRS